MDTEPDLLNWTVRVEDAKRQDLSARVEAGPAECAAVAVRLGLLALDRLGLDYAVSSLAKGRYRVKGRIEAMVEQACVVTLEAVPAEIVETFDLEFWPSGDIEALAAMEQAPQSETDGLDWPEPIVDGRMDIGRIAYETLATALDPYPHAEGAALVVEEDAASTRATNPFAVLKTLKDN